MKKIMLVSLIPLLIFNLLVNLRVIGQTAVSQQNSKKQSAVERKLIHGTVGSLPVKSKRYAIVIGVDKYDDQQISTLSGAVNDAQTLAQSLVRYAGFPSDQVFLLASDQVADKLPTRANILRRISNLAGSIPKDALLFISFAGHGIEREGNAFLLPTDAQFSNDIKLLEETSINLKLLKEQIRTIGTDQVMLVLDACRNNPEAGRAGGANVLTNAFTRSLSFDVLNEEVKAFVTLYATDVGKSAYEYKEKKQGYFTWALVEALKGAAADDDGGVTLERIVKYLQLEVPRRVRLDLGKDQRTFAIIEGYKANELLVAISLPRQDYLKLLDVKREVPRGSLNVIASRPGIEITIDGKPFGKSEASGEKFRVDNLIAGQRVKVVGQLTGKPKYEKEVEIIADQEIELRIGWKKQIGRVIDGFEGQSRTTSLAITPDGTKALSGGPGGIFVWNMETGHVIRRFETGSRDIHRLLCTPDGQYCASVGKAESVVRLWALETGQMIRRFEAPEGQVHNFEFSPDGKYLLTEGKDIATRIWDVESGNELWQFGAQEKGFISGTFSRNSSQYVTYSESEVIFWNLADGREIKRFILPAAYSGLDSISLLSNDSRMIFHYSGGLVLWDLEQKKAVWTYILNRLDGYFPKSLRSSSDGKKLLACDEMRWWCFEVESGKLIGTYPENIDMVFSPDGKYLFSAQNQGKKLVLSNVETGQEVKVLKGNIHSYSTIAVSPNNQQVLVADSQQIVEFDVTTRKETRRMISQHKREIKKLLFSSDGKYFVSNDVNQRISLWDFQTGKEIGIFEGADVLFSPDSRFLLTTTNTSLRLLDLADGKEIQRFSGHLQPIQSIAFSSDGKKIASGSLDKTVRVWDISSGQEIRRFQHPEQIEAVAFSNDGNRLVSVSSLVNLVPGNSKFKVCVWDIGGGREIRCFAASQIENEKKYEFFAMQICILPDGQNVIETNFYKSENGTLHLWNVETAQSVESQPVKGDFESIVSSLDGGLIVIFRTNESRSSGFFLVELPEVQD